MNVNDINQTVLAQLDPQVAQALIEAQIHANTIDAVLAGVAYAALAIVFWTVFKYT